jgi:hypothetical protein
VEARPNVKMIVQFFNWYFQFGPNSHLIGNPQTYTNTGQIDTPQTTQVYKIRIANPMYVGAEPTTTPSGSFIEMCDTFDKTIWDVEWDNKYGTQDFPQILGDGTWTEFFAKGTHHFYQIYHKDINKFSYGHYKITFQTSGPRDPGVNFGTFFYYGGSDPAGYSYDYNELDIPEVQGPDGQNGHNDVDWCVYSNIRKIDVDNRVTGKTYPIGKAGLYDYFTLPYSVAGGPHIFEFDWLSTGLKFWMDGTLCDTWTTNDAGYDGTTGGAYKSTMPYPPMLFYPFGASGTPQNGDYWVKVLQIEYTPAG